MAVRLERALHQRLWNAARVEAGAFTAVELAAVAGALRAAGVAVVFSGADSSELRLAVAGGYAAEEWFELQTGGGQSDAEAAEQALAQLEALAQADGEAAEEGESI